MYKKFVKLTLGLALVFGTMSFIACSDEEEILNPSKKSEESTNLNISKTHVDSVAAEITTFHTEAMVQFLYSMYQEGDTLSDAYKHNLYNFIINKVKSYNFTTFDTTGFNENLATEAEIFEISDMSISDAINRYDTVNFFNVSVINSIISTINDSMSFIFDTLTDLKYFDDSYTAMTDRQLSVVSPNDYLVLRIYATMNLGSMYVWYNYYDGAFNFKSSKKKPDPDAWEKAKEIMKEDAKDAAKGAIFGAIKGFIKSLPTGNPTTIAIGTVTSAAKEGVAHGAFGSACEFVKQQYKNNKPK